MGEIITDYCCGFCAITVVATWGRQKVHTHGVIFLYVIISLYVFVLFVEVEYIKRVLS